MPLFGSQDCVYGTDMAMTDQPVTDVDVGGETNTLPVVPVVIDAATSSQSSRQRPLPATVPCPQHVLDAIYGNSQDKDKMYQASLQRWWEEYSDRKNDEEDEHVSDSLLYDRSHLPRSIPAPDCVVLKPPSRTGAASTVVAAGVTISPRYAAD